MIFLTIMSGKVEKSCLSSPGFLTAIFLGVITWRSCDPIMKHGCGCIWKLLPNFRRTKVWLIKIKSPIFCVGSWRSCRKVFTPACMFTGEGGVVRSDPFGGDHPWSQTPLVRTSSGGHQSGRTGMHTYFPHKNDITFIPPAIPSTVALNTCGSKGQQRRAPPLRLNSFIFKQFSAKMLQNNRLVQLLWVRAPSEKSWIRHCSRYCYWSILNYHFITGMSPKLQFDTKTKHPRYIP